MRRYLFAGLFLGLLVCALQPEQPVYAQQPGTPANNTPANTVNPSGTPATGAPATGNVPTSMATTRIPGQFPPNFTSFYRGNASPSMPAPRAGYYFSLFKLILVFALFFLWAWSSNWAFKDGKNLKCRPEHWSTISLLAGFFGFLLVITVPSFPIGFLLCAAAYGVPIGLYVQERNERVPENAKVMTKRHIQSVIIRSLARMGIKIGSADAMEQAIGPPIEFIGKSGGRGADRSRQVESSRGYLSAKELIYDAILRRATDVHIEPKEEEVAIRLRIDGVMYPTEPFDRSVGDAITNIFKVLGGMDITEKRRSQDGSFRAEMDLREIDFRVATQGTRFGEKMSIRILDQSSSVSSLAQLGMRKQMVESMKEIVHQPHGMFLCCGPTGAGKSTTLYACLNDLDAFEKNIITVEDPIEYKMDNITQIEINTKADQTFGKALRSILRQDPDVVMIGEIRDGETAKVACQAAATGHMVFSTVHGNDTFTALFRLMDLDVETYMLADSISGILGQRLARRLCPDCKVPYKPKPELLKQAKLPVDKIDKFYRPPTDGEGQCTTCGDLGFKGRVGVYELLQINERISDLIRDKAPASAMKAEAVKNNFHYMREEGIRLVVRGITSMDEMMRVVK